MAMLFQCDVCRSTLDRREVFEVELALGAVLLGENMETRFVQGKQAEEYLLCARCWDYFTRAVAALRRETQQPQAGDGDAQAGQEAAA
ncbi:MAG: hypothetical protein M0R73_01360 [Dehalococcoidia bacterium]|nr:hypothetical protein [Dehalococcoidia bacterium]